MILIFFFFHFYLQFFFLGFFFILTQNFHELLGLNKGLQRAGSGRPARRSKAHGPARGGPLSPLTGQRAGPLVYLRPVAQPVCPQAGRAWVKIKIVFSFEGKGFPFPYGSIRELATNWTNPLLYNYFALVIYILEMLYDFWKKIKVSLLFNGHMTVEHVCHSIQYYDRWMVLKLKKNKN